MSTSSSTVNTIFNVSEWETGQSVVGTAFTTTLAVQSLATTTFLNRTKSLSSGIWAITGTFIITSAIDDTVLADVAFQVQQPYNPTIYQPFYYNATLDAAESVTASFTTIIGVSSTYNPLTYGILLNYDTPSTNVNIQGTWKFVRIA
jgi:esterase/lipase superfamily enzyme